MPKLGPNIRCVAARRDRDDIARFYSEIFGADISRPAADLDVFTLSDGSCIGVYFVADDDALTPTQQEAVGTWIELGVEDLAQIEAALGREGFEPLRYHDRTHAYFQAPGGQVFRLAAA